MFLRSSTTAVSFNGQPYQGDIEYLVVSAEQEYLFVTANPEEEDDLFATAKPEEEDDLFVTAEQEEDYLFVTTKTPATVTTQPLEETLDQKIKRANNIAPAYALTSIPEQLYRYSIVVPKALHTYNNKVLSLERKHNLNVAAYQLLDAASFEFPLLTQGAPNALERFKYHIVVTLLYIEDLKNRFFLDQVMPALKTNTFTNKKTLLNHLKVDVTQNSYILWLWKKVWQDAMLKKIIQGHLDRNTFEKIQNRIQAAIHADNLTNSHEIKEFLMSRDSDLRPAEWKKLKAYQNFDTLLEYILLKQKTILEQAMMAYTRRNYSSLPAADLQAYHQGMQKIIAEIDKKNRDDDVLANYPSLTLLSKLMSVFDRENTPALLVYAYSISTHSLYRSTYRSYGFPQDYYVPSLSLTMALFLTLYTRAGNVWHDIGASDKQFMVQRYQENLQLKDLNLLLPTWIQLKQVQQYPQHNPETSFFKRNADRLHKNTFYGTITMATGLALYNSMGAMSKNTKLEDTVPGIILFISMLIFFNWVVMTRALNYGRNLDNAVRHSEERYQTHIDRRATFHSVIDKVESVTHTITSSAHRLWHKPKPTPIKIEVIDEKKSNERRVRK